MTPMQDIIKAYMLKNGYHRNKRNGITYRKLAKQIGIHEVNMSAFINGKLMLKPSNIKKICDILGIDYPRLMLLNGVVEGRFRKEMYAKAMDYFTNELGGIDDIGRI
jgi:cyanate lyase